MAKDESQNPAQNTGNSADTSDEPTASPAADEGRHEEEQESVGASPEGEAPADDKADARAKRLEGKLKKEQGEIKRLQTLYGGVSSWIMKDPKRMKDALVQTSGKSDEEANGIVKRYYPNWQESSEEATGGEAESESTQVPTTPEQPVDPLYQMAAAEAIEEKKGKILDRQKAAEDFYKDNPDISPGDYNVVLQAARALQDKAQKSGENLSPKDAIDLANKRIFHTDKLLKEAEEQGENRGLATASSIASSTMKSPSGTVPAATEEEPDIPAQEWQAAQLAGFKDKKEYVLYRDNPQLSVAPDDANK